MDVYDKRSVARTLQRVAQDVERAARDAERYGMDSSVQRAHAADLRRQAVMLNRSAGATLAAHTRLFRYGSYGKPFDHVPF